MTLFRPLALALTTPVAIILGYFGITVAEDDVQTILLAVATILGAIGTVWGPSIKALIRHKGSAE